MAPRAPSLQTTDPSILRISERAAAQENAMVSRTGKPVKSNIDAILRSAKSNSALVIGKVYHLYQGSDGYVLAVAKYENQDKYQYIDSFRLTAMDVWEGV